MITAENSKNIRKGLYCSWNFSTAFSYAMGQTLEEYGLRKWDRNEKTSNFKEESKWFKKIFFEAV